jgi:hypothetical protein
MTRWHEDDVAGRILADMTAGGEQWEGAPSLGPVHGEFVNYAAIGIWNRPRSGSAKRSR